MNQSSERSDGQTTCPVSPARRRLSTVHDRHIGAPVPERYPAMACVRSSYDPGAQAISHRLPSGSARYPE